MTKREQLLDVYRHKNPGYIPCFFTDFDFSKPAAIHERPEQGGLDWFGVEWEFVPAVLASGGSFVAFPLTVSFDFVPVFIDEQFKHVFRFGER